MPVLPAVPTSGPIAPGHREPLGQLMQPHPSRGVAATGTNITASAVQQAQALTKADLAAPRPVLHPHDKRHRLVGPPPSFEVNVIQHLRESLTAAPISPDDNDTSTRPPETVGGKGPYGAYSVLSELPVSPDNAPETHVNISL
ncbi:hypothetical protein [Roseinatronobacter sp. S2]|uniref:hypothetical protein n=1 Tax=Roseinatronobacter sp. S2 TaxID=3035471 RepID=UPI00240F1D3B|nr:hypothetical protein [Roseinatronobacter sp. S2]WFE75444.1 hypothetical protein P8S53_03290 [Roseinatronobacter sp. S2]